MDCGDFIAYVYHTTFGLDLMNHENEDPWHIKDMYADANKYKDSQFFEFVYKNVPISNLDESKLEKGDIVLYFGPRDNHGLIYVGEGMQTAHASRNGIKYSKNPPILGFEVVTLNRFYKTSTKVSIVRIKDGVIPTEMKANTAIIWPDNGERQQLVPRNDEIVEEEQESEELENIAVLNLLESPENIEFASANDMEQIEKVQSEKIIIYIEKDMYSWVSDGLKRFYEASDSEKQENI